MLENGDRNDENSLEKSLKFTMRKGWMKKPMFGAMCRSFAPGISAAC
jgi:hypothetical protein